MSGQTGDAEVTGGDAGTVDESTVKATTSESTYAENESQDAKGGASADDEHKEKSKLGIRVSKMERGIESIKDEIRSNFEKLMESQRSQQPTRDEFNEIPDDEYLTGKQVKELLRKHVPEIAEKVTVDRQNLMANSKKKYVDTYLDTFASMSETEELSDEESKKVYQTMLEKFDVDHSKGTNPSGDAQINFYRALRFMEKSKTKNPLKGGKPEIPIGVGGGDIVKGKATPTIKLSPEAEAFMRSIGKDEKWAKEALANS